MSPRRTLRDLALQECACVASVQGDARVRVRLLEMGVLPGTPIQKIGASPLGDPLIFLVRGYRLSLRRAEAACVSIEALRSEERAPIDLEAEWIAPRDHGRERPEIVLTGNPNSGKTTLFNQLTGGRARVGNYPGITVERAVGSTLLAEGVEASVVDVPGTYSLSAHSPEEQVAVEALVPLHGKGPDLVVVVSDATVLARSLYFLLQVLETDVPVVLALNMMDEAAAAGVAIDAAKLGARLGIEVVSTVASRGEGLDALRGAIARTLKRTADREKHRVFRAKWGESAAREIAEVERLISLSHPSLSPGGAKTHAILSLLVPSPWLGSNVEAAATRIRKEGADNDLEVTLVRPRYAAVDALVAEVVRAPATPGASWTARIDRVVTHPVLGPVLFALVMLVVFQSLFAWSAPATDAIDGGTQLLRGWISDLLPEGAIRDLLVDGVLAGVGNVVVFVPQIALLFLFIVVLEDSGYLARVALLVDRLMSKVGLHGKAFVPLLSGFACAVPAVMATRTIESRRDRLVTMLALPLMSCSARLPIFALVIATVFHAERRVIGFLSVGGLVLFAMYAISVVATLTAAAVLGRTVLKGKRPPLVLELPPYRVPQIKGVLLAVWRRVRAFLTDAGTLILAFTVLLWALLSYPKDRVAEAAFANETQRIEKQVPQGSGRDAALARVRERHAEVALAYSAGGRVGKWMEPAIRPLGFDWKIGVGLVGSFAAREVLVSTLGVAYGLGERGEEDASLRSALRNARHADGSPVFTPLAGVSLMVFFLFACQCMSTIAVVRRESGSWKWPALMFAYMTSLAYVASLAVYQVGTAFGWGGA